ncbi:hydrogenase maturation protease [Marinobacterium marinum]|uniref:Hydrogenase maturation protease n=1 Tax=Marinobacterium marinum TaxID=2756129 RepID=A0A7W2ABU0_9GAMM|nr:hydrogenase maturation protease [Marinobacterium marinum]MBA4502410.1 hydrogenase maturation protease [Marinobacterium marinum]
MSVCPTPEQQHMIIGIGSPFGDDRAGWEVIERLQRMKLPPCVRLLSLDRPGVELIERMQGHAQVTLIDAMHDRNHPPGTLLALQPSQLAHLNLCSSHAFGLAQTLALALRLNRLPARLHLIGIGVTPPSTFCPDEHISPEVEAAIETLARQLMDECQTAIGSSSCTSITDVGSR